MSILKPEITGKHYERREKQPAENQKSTNIEYEVSASPVFTFSFLGTVRSFAPLVSYATILNVLLSLGQMNGRKRF